MPKSQRSRSRLFPVDMVEFFHNVVAGIPLGDQSFIDNPALNAAMAPRTFLYTSTAGLTTTAGVPWYPTHAGEIVAISLNVAGAPVSTLTCDILMNGNSIFDSTDTKPTIAASSLFGLKETPGRNTFSPGDKIQVQLTATGTATGPMVVTFLYYSEV